MLVTFTLNRSEPASFSQVSSSQGTGPKALGVERCFRLKNFGKINAEGLVLSDVALNPLDVWSEIPKDVVRFSCRSAKLVALKGADIRNVSLNDKPA
jgi:hypothetical protein